MSVRVRYAPSPTGFQHIGGVRTALFNYLFAKANGGQFILRVEDTDRARYFDGALQDIFDTFEWLGIEADEGPYFQSERVEIHQKHAKQLVEQGQAYYCYCDSDRLEEMRKHQEENKLAPGYDRHCRNLSAEQIQEAKKSGIKPVIRFKAPLEGTTSFKDQILGEISVENETLQDFVLLKSDGFPTYHLANIVDDHLMDITHVLRAQEWIPSTPSHVLLYKAFGWEHPTFCHLPMVMGEDNKKLSKRHGATQVLEFRKKGYLAEALVNFLSLLGWSYNDTDEVFSLEQLKEIFDIKRINKSPAVFNYKKLLWFNGLYIREMSIDRLYDLTIDYYKEAHLVSEDPSAEEIAHLKEILPLVQERIELLSEAPMYSSFMFGQDVEYQTWENIYPKKVEKSAMPAILEDVKAVADKIDSLTEEEYKQTIYDISQKHGVKMGAVFMPVRIAMTGIDKSPELFPIMQKLGKDLIIKRLDAAIARIKSEL